MCVSWFCMNERSAHPRIKLSCNSGQAENSPLFMTPTNIHFYIITYTHTHSTYRLIIEMCLSNEYIT